MKIQCKCGNGCDYEASTYETANKLTCSNSRQSNNKTYYFINEVDDEMHVRELKDETTARHW